MEDAYPTCQQQREQIMAREGEERSKDHKKFFMLSTSGKFYLPGGHAQEAAVEDCQARLKGKAPKKICKRRGFDQPARVDPRKIRKEEAARRAAAAAQEDSSPFVIQGAIPPTSPPRGSSDTSGRRERRASPSPSLPERMRSEIVSPTTWRA